MTIARLQQFLYLLGRDLLDPVAVTQTIAKTSDGVADYSNLDLADWAAEQARTLVPTKAASPPSLGTDSTRARDAEPFFVNGPEGYADVRKRLDDGGTEWFCCGVSIAKAQRIADAINAAEYLGRVLDLNSVDPNLRAAMEFVRTPYETAGTVILHLLNVLNDRPPNEHASEAGTAGIGASLWDEIMKGGDPAEFRIAFDHAGMMIVHFGEGRQWFVRVDEALRKAGLYIATAEELDPPVCRLQLPDGSVPGNAAEAAQAWYDAYEEQRQSARGKVDLLSSTLAQCAKRFREYEQLHRAKLPNAEAYDPNGEVGIAAKVERNRRMAAMCEAAIDGWWMTVPGRDPDTIAECIALVRALPSRGLGAVARRDVVAALTRHIGEQPPAPDGGPSGTGLPDSGQLASKPGGPDCYGGSGCDEFPGLRGGDHAAWQARHGPFRYGRHDRGWPTHPVDAFEALARHMGYDLDRDKLAEVRRHCDEPVRVYDPRPPFAGLRGMTVQASKAEGGYVPVDLGEFALVILEEVERRQTRRQRRVV